MAGRSTMFEKNNIEITQKASTQHKVTGLFLFIALLPLVEVTRKKIYFMTLLYWNHDASLRATVRMYSLTHASCTCTLVSAWCVKKAVLLSFWRQVLFFYKILLSVSFVVLCMNTEWLYSEIVFVPRTHLQIGQQFYNPYHHHQPTNPTVQFLLEMG